MKAKPTTAKKEVKEKIGRETILAINKLVKKHLIVMLVEEKGQIYVLVKHWQYLDYKMQAKRKAIGPGVLGGDKYKYVERSI